MLGQRIRHLRAQRGLTLAQLGERVGRGAPFLSQLENGRREATVSVLGRIAEALEAELSALLDPTPPTRRAELEIGLRRAQHEPLYRELGLPELQPSARLPDEALEHILRLFAELKRQRSIRAQTPEEARQANARLRREMRERDNHFPEIEAVARTALAAIGHDRGPLSQRRLEDLASHFGFAIHPASDLPASVRSLTDTRNQRLYVPSHDQLDASDLRTIVLQTLGHLALDHRDPADFGAFLRQRVEANYFAGAVLMPEDAAVEVLRQARADRDLSVTDLEELFGVSYETAAHRFTNLATRHLDIPVHFVRSDRDGVIWKAYENDDVPFPSDPDGAIEGQRLCVQWGTRQVFARAPHPLSHHQYTDTPNGTYWCVTRPDSVQQPAHAITVGVRFADAKHFRGRNTSARATSGCPQGPCCREPAPELADKWDAHAWPSPRPHSHVLAALPAGTFPGVDLAEAYAFLERAEHQA